MFICDGCHKAIGPGILPIRVVTDYRVRTYPPRLHVNPPYNRVKRKDYSQWNDDPGGKGWEIVRESLVCFTCHVREGGWK